MNNKEKERKMKEGIFIFPEKWVELNPEKARECTYVTFLVEKEKCGVYYSVAEASKLSEAEEKEVRKLGENMGFSKEANIFGFIEDTENVGNARITKE